jgi:hypothetical protein
LSRPIIVNLQRSSRQADGITVRRGQQWDFYNKIGPSRQWSVVGFRRVAESGGTQRCLVGRIIRFLLDECERQVLRDLVHQELRPKVGDGLKG